MQAWAASLAKAGAVTAGLGASAGGPLLALFKQAAERGADVQTLADRFGTTTDAVQELAYAFQKGGVSLDQFGGMLDGLASSISAAADENKELIQGLRGLNGRALLTKSLPEQLDLIFNGLASIVSEQDRVREANRLGLGGMLPYLKDGAAGLAKFKAEAHGVGAVLSPEEAKQGKQVMLAWDRVMREGTFTLMSFGAALLPSTEGVGSLADGISHGLKRVRDWVKENKGLIVTVAAVAAGVVAAGVAFGVLGGVAWTVSAAIGVLNVLLGVLLSPLGLTAAAVGGLTYLFLTQTDAGKNWAAQMGTYFERTKRNAVDSFSAIGEALTKGDFQAAWNIFTTFIEVEWTRLEASLSETWHGFLDFFADGWDTAKYLVAAASADIGETFSTLFVQGMRTGFLQFEELTRKALRTAALLFDAFDADMARNLRAIADAPRDQVLGALNAAQKEAEREAVRAKNEAQAELDAARKAREDAAAERKGGYDAKIAELQQRLDNLNAAQHGRGKGPTGGGGGGPNGPALPNLSALQKGLFAGPVQMQVGYADETAKRQLDAAVQTAANTKQIADKIGGFNPTAFKP